MKKNAETRIKCLFWKNGGAQAPPPPEWRKSTKNQVPNSKVNFNI